MAIKEIERNPISPRLNSNAKKLLTELCFRQDDTLKKVDGIFIFASLVDLKKLAKLVERILNEGASKKVFISGGVISNERARSLKLDEGSIESEMILKYLDTKRYNDVKFYTEKRSTNTLENVTETLKNKEFKKCKSLLFIFKSHAAGRGFLTLKRFFQNTGILQLTFNTKYKISNKSITKNNWHTFAFGKSRVWGEYLRIKKYGGRGDIEYKSVAEIINKIEKEIKN